MTVTVDAWTCGGAIQNAISPDTVMVNASGATTWNVTYSFLNASGGLVTVGTVTIGLWDVTTNTQLQAVGPFNNVNTANFSLGGSMTNNSHAISLFCNITAGPVDHFIAATTNNPIGANPHAVFWVRRSGVWVAVSGHELRIRRGGAWVPVQLGTSNNAVFGKCGVMVRRSGIWISP